MPDVGHDKGLLGLLSGYGYEALLQMAAFHRLATTTPDGRKASREVLIPSLARQLSDPLGITKALSGLSPAEHAVLDHLLLRAGPVATSSLRAELQQEGVAQPGPPEGARRPHEGDASTPEEGHFEDVLARLTLRGLVLSTGHASPWTPQAKLGLSPGQLLVVAEPLRSLLPKPALPPVDWGRGNLPRPIEESDTSSAQRDLFTYWSFVRSQKAPMTQAGLVQRRTLRAINEQLLFPDPSLANAANESSSPRLYFMRLLLQELALLVEDHGHLCVAGQPGQVPQFWEQSVEQRTKTCLEAWLPMKKWNELASRNMLAFDLDLNGARSVLLDQLRLLEPGSWVSAELFLNRLTVVAPHLLLQPRGPAQSVTLHYGETSYFARHRGWLEEAQGTFVGSALSGPLRWLGLLDISADEGRVLAFRVNGGGARALDLGPVPPLECPSEGRVVVQPNFQILALGPVPEAVLARLEVFVDRVKADRSALEYVLSRQAVYRAQKDGVSVGEIMAFLQQVAGVVVPHNVLRTLQEWGEQHERIVVHRAVTLCETDGPESLERLWSDGSLQTHLRDRLTPTVALVKRGRLAALHEALLQQNEMPAVSSKDDLCAGRVEAMPDGELHPVHIGPDLILETRLHGLAEERDGQFCVTEGALGRAIATGMGVREYLRQLTALNRGPLPAALEARVKAWGHYYGAASLKQATLLEVKDAATADELVADPELAPLLSRFTADPQGRVLLVDGGHVERVRRLLVERGVELH